MTAASFEPRVNARHVVVALLAGIIVCGVFMGIRPGWDSVEGVSTWHRFFQLAKWCFAAGVLLMEAGGLYYSSRRDHLQRERAKAEERQRNEAVSEADRRAREAEIAAAKATEAAAGRSLSPAQTETIKRVLSKAPSDTIRIVYADGESMNYGSQVGDAIRAAGWTVHVFSGSGMLGFSPSRETMIEYRFAIEADGHMTADKIEDLHPQAPLPPSAFMLADALKQAGIPTRFEIYPGPPSGRPRHKYDYEGPYLYLGYK